MHRILILVALATAAGGMGVTHFSNIEERLDELDRYRQVAPSQARQIEDQVERLGREIDAMRRLLGELESAPGSLSQELNGRLDELEVQLGSAVAGIHEQQTELERLGLQGSEWSPDLITAQMAELSAGVNALQSGVDERWQGLSTVVSATVRMAEQNQSVLTDLGGKLRRDSRVLWRELVGPTVQLAGDMTVGSGVLLESRPVKGGEEHETLLLTSWHVVRDIRADAGRDDIPIPVSIYTESGGVWYETATLLEHDVPLDAALLRLDTTKPVQFGARLATREQLHSMRTFESIYAVGCPLGNDPIPTAGEIADTHHRVDGNIYWMISAPTYIGNSGGGIYDPRNGALLGIFSKIYTHGNLRPTVVPHMGLVTPLEQIYDWLEEEGYAHLVTVENESQGRKVALVR